ncbi:glycosyltransferase family 4 protein [Pedobacter metabolipauper]|uniref:Glycosyltransferase involved in cell wall biosynthesis n=1 Tax=Pedobacter metabolipauper TaxID=425513 RepID=A0A4R6SVV3_9SPHI|nr:glycosyltransferase family 4 protein [Pedobacter metabolipauper]TDQ09940.1 glycosyltransferase involved in cell wall biosynthesis [Pedobacter metabolipauper]
MKNKLIRITTVPLSLEKLLEHQLKFMQQHYQVTAVSADEPRLKEVGKKEGVDVFSVELTRQITPVADLKALFKLYRFLKKEKPLIVHSHTPKAGTIGMLAAKLAGVPHRLHTVAGLPLMEVTGKKRQLLNLVEKVTYACATRVYPNSFGLKEIIIKENFCTANKLKVIGKGSTNGINTDYFNPEHFTVSERQSLKMELNIKDEDQVFIFVGRLVGDKGINELVAAFKILNKDLPDSKLLLVGDQEQELDPLFPDSMEEIKNNPDIISVGYQADVRPYFAISDVLAFPSYREGFPNVVMQAGAMGLPSIVSDINGCNEIIVENKNGWIVPPKNMSALLDAMIKFVNNKAEVDKLKPDIRNTIVDLYGQKAVWDAILAEYRALENKNV